MSLPGPFTRAGRSLKNFLFTFCCPVRVDPGRVDAGVQTDPPEFSNQDVSIADGRSDVTNNNNTLTSLSASVDDSSINIDASWTEYDFGQTGPFEFFLLEPQDQMLLYISSLSDVGDFTVPFGNQSLEAQEQTLLRYPSLPDADDSTIPSGNQLLEAQYQMHLHYPNVPDVELSEMDHRLSDITEDIISASSTTHSSTFVAHEQSQLLPPSPLTELTDSNDAEDKEDAEDGNEERADDLRNIPIEENGELNVVDMDDRTCSNCSREVEDAGRYGFLKLEYKPGTYECMRCYSYWRRNEKPRPELADKNDSLRTLRTAELKNHICSNCNRGAEDIGSSYWRKSKYRPDAYECSTCVSYYRRNEKPRPFKKGKLNGVDMDRTCSKCHLLIP